MKHCRRQAAQTGSKTVDDALLVLCDGIQVKNGDKSYQKFGSCKLLWECCGEDDVKLGKYGGRRDPVVKLYRGSQHMLTENSDVAAGLANGTRARVNQVILKAGEEANYITTAGGFRVRAVRASQVDHIVMDHENDRINPSAFNVEPTPFAGLAKLPAPSCLQTGKGDDCHGVHIKATQLPFVSNSATTGHKLQGRGVENLFVHTWSYKKNWPYVILSRVKTLKGLFLRYKLKADLKLYAMPQNLKRMLNRFRERSIYPEL